MPKLQASSSAWAFTGFFFLLRECGLRVSLNQWLTLLRGLEFGLHDQTLLGFYELARTVLVTGETELDEFDIAFKHYFEGKELPPLEDMRQNILDWLRQAQQDGLLAHLERIEDNEPLEDILARYHELLDTQDERHDGGDTWIGTGGSSRFGHSGRASQPGIRVGGPGGGKSAIAVAGERRFAGYRDDVVLDTRQLAAALKRLRKLGREGVPEELDLPATIEATGRNAGDIDIRFRPERQNTTKLLLLMDSGGSMAPYASLCSTLFSAANQLSHFKDFQHFYFHNCIYQSVYRDDLHRERVSVADLLHKYDRTYKVIFVGDACMAPHELYHPWYADGRSGLQIFETIREHFDHVVWLNPEPEDYWRHVTIDAVRKTFSMFPLTVKGLEEAVSVLEC